MNLTIISRMFPVMLLCQSLCTAAPEAPVDAKIAACCKTIPTEVNSEKTPVEADFIGLTIKDAQTLADKHKLPHRVIMIDGKPQPATRDYRPDRFNFTVEKGKVTQVTKG